jgi:hypothetical protein
MLEEYEDDITEWYFKHREYDLLEWLCELRVLKKEDQGNSNGGGGVRKEYGVYEGPEGVKWELEFAYFWLGKWNSLKNA